MSNKETKPYFFYFLSNIPPTVIKIILFPLIAAVYFLGFNYILKADSYVYVK